VIEEEVARSQSGALSPRLAVPNKGKKEEKNDGNVSPRSPRGGLPEPKKEKEEKKKPDEKEEKKKGGRTLDTKKDQPKGKMALPKTLANQPQSGATSNPNVAIPKIALDKPPERPLHAPQRPTSVLPGASKGGAEPAKPVDLFSEIKAASEMKLRQTV
jgi:hypothetical protein